MREADTRQALASLMEKLWSMSPDRGLDEDLLADTDRGFRGGFATAPVWVVVGGDTTNTADRTSLAASVYPAVQNLLLAATALGLGSAMTTIATYAPDAVRAFVDLPEQVKPMALVPLGWPERPLRPPVRRPVAEIAHRDRYGTPW